ncbi:homoserine dehydrogenase [Mahella australiensis]|uniref:Homoserine dehydrogenase n=1 Tax=Mahella australiensis (strain DSM 15567 / CIP 107919 / 50-1 BON) TaxID=697281 RepID=F4A0M5_MAHA5|nr:homoserine dehydrogenase [Mahella australiensis]AEE95904.1 homoserine dehydrogenase [Mahella australiensis 50-1 BON]
MAYVAVMGHGTVGSGVVEVLRKNKDSIEKKAGESIILKKILDRRSFPDLPYSDLFTTDAEEILNDDEIQVIVEVMGGVEPAYTYVKRALSSGKHVVTSNKELVAEHGAELLRLARDRDVNFFFEASVGGGIPIIRPLNQCLAANEISEIIGILNGTTNYILTQMRLHGKTFEQALKDAQEKGYAESDPSNDIDGYDAARKIAILASIAFNRAVSYRDVYTEGISTITRLDMIYADEMDYAIKLIAMCKDMGDKLMARVSPLMIPKSSPLATVDDAFNAILVRGDVIGDVMFYGMGAGKLPTASAVVADVIDAVKHLKTRKKEVWADSEGYPVMDINDVKSRYFIRAAYKDRSDAVNAVRELFGDVNLVFCNDPIVKDEFGFISDEEPESMLNDKMAILSDNDAVSAVINRIRVEDNL